MNFEMPKKKEMLKIFYLISYVFMKNKNKKNHVQFTFDLCSYYADIF